MENILHFLGSVSWWIWIIIAFVILAIRDVFFNKRHTITHNFPIVGHFRYWLESIGPEMRQYFVANNREELPFNRIERGWVYASSKNENNYEGFGTDRDIYQHQHIFVKNCMIPYQIEKEHPNKIDKSFLPCAKVMGLYNKRKKPYRPGSVINISAMSFGSLSAKAIESLNIGVQKSNAYHNTGEGGLSPYHSNGGDVVFHFGTGYFGVRDDNGNFSMQKMKELVQNNPFVKAIEIKLSQGAKPGKGGVLPGKKITPQIAKIGTGAAPPSFADHVSLPWIYGFTAIYNIFQKHNLTDRIVFIGSGKLGFPAKAAMAFAMGVDCINVAREAMMSIGCIQAQICHTNKCPTGIATQSKWLQSGINIPLKSDRLAQYFKTFKKEFIEITHAAGYEHPCQFTMKDIDINVDDGELTRTLEDSFRYSKTPVEYNCTQDLKQCDYLGGYKE